MTLGAILFGVAICCIIVWLSTSPSAEEEMRRDLEHRRSIEPDEDEYDDWGLRRPLKERQRRRGLREDE